MKTIKQVVLNVCLSEEEVAHCVKLAAMVCNSLMKTRSSDKGTDVCIKSSDTGRFEIIKDFLKRNKFDKLDEVGYDKIHIEMQG